LTQWKRYGTNKTMENSSLTVTIDRTLCIGAAACLAAAPEYFELDEENIAVTKVAIPISANTEAAKRVRDAVDSCPTGAIHVAVIALG